ncbi:MAG: Cytochrome c-type biogenesis protein CcmE [Alphaproteobacteria bacterium MarineAlpha5_Bin5]|nr:MAG: Cytochrome c-type biogenesis protein CcmE [Alphaproteobacteria bacterium MarineAlpha5_Bin4]PPR50164.1 MAG: Cytochrome c-type biogenesis protein CcmE [Alphaproteobacteria bacterium MarineAlpha5_Bin5]
MSLRFQRLFLILVTFVLLLAAVLLILFNSQKNIIFFYTPSELINEKPKVGQNIRIGGFVKEDSLKKITINSYEFEITDNNNAIFVYYNGILPDLFREGQGAVVDGIIEKPYTIKATNIYAKHDENYMPASIKEDLEKNNQWKKNYK